VRPSAVWELTTSLHSFFPSPRGLLDNGYSELAIISDHVVATDSLPLIHKDPFDRILVAQATFEGVTLLTIDSLVARYPGPIRTV
jgi:PIN domain nuclease of toxin-antitoxin system